MNRDSKPCKTLEEFATTSYLSGSNAAYLETLYEDYLQDPDSIEPEWSEYFKTLQQEMRGEPDSSHALLRLRLQQSVKKRAAAPAVSASSGTANKQGNVDALVTAYRRFGHLSALINPLKLQVESEADSRLKLSHHHLSDSDLSDTFETRSLLPASHASLKDILHALKKVYCGAIGFEYSRMTNEEEREWLRVYIEQKLPSMTFSSESKRTFLKKLVAADGLEKYLENKYPGQKRFSIEGADSMIPMLHELCERSRLHGAQEVVIGMAHRGRLNVLLNIMGQSPSELFQEFDGTMDYGLTTGDVKYHRGFSSDVKTKEGPIHLSLAFNPSHLEFINPVVLGSVRARQERFNGGTKIDYAIPVLIHGDAAFSGQGVVMETLSMSQTRAYRVGGAIHIILNNQVGFTTSDPRDLRSSHYCSDVAKMIDAPIFHVNGDEVEAVIKAVTMALDYRMQFKKDVVIDLVCYRRRGHQEVDEPRATQPLMYQIINKHPTVKAIYSERLLEEGVCQQEELDQWTEQYRDRLDKGQDVVEIIPQGLSSHRAANWTPFLEKNWRHVVDTTVELGVLNRLGARLTQIPEEFVLQRNVDALIKARRAMQAGQQPLDWGYAEMMAYATLLSEGFHVRFSGEDSRRGTFFHRHAAVFDQKTGACYEPLKHLFDEVNGSQVQIYDSLLSEAGVLGFEYGYATSDPNALVIWEAQFGDFANGAQVIIDQFISSGWQKWRRLSGLVLFLPHGYEGMGPEHSSARLERYLQLCAQENIQVFVPTTPAQIFHLLRRQVIRPYRKPLIVMMPKSLLRHKLSVSSLEELATGQLKLVIPEVDAIDPQKVERVIVCSGKVYYELLEKRREQEIETIALIRIEQLYPFPYEELSELLLSYPNAEELVWCQEEPKNQGAWFYTYHRLVKCLPSGWKVFYVGRRSMAAPAGGYSSLHLKQQKGLIHRALKIEENA